MDPLSRVKYGNWEILPEMQILDAISNLQNEKISIQSHTVELNKMAKPEISKSGQSYPPGPKLPRLMVP